MKKLAGLFFCILLLVTIRAYADNSVYETEWISTDELTKIVDKMGKNRLFPSSVEGKIDGIVPVYKAKFSPFLVGLDYFYSYWGMSDTWYEKKAKYFKEKGFREYFHSTFLDLSGNTVHQATWILLSK